MLNLMKKQVCKSAGCFLFAFILSIQIFGQDIVGNVKAAEEIVKQIELPQIPNYKVRLTDFASKLRLQTDAKPAFDKAIRKLSGKGGGVLTVPQGNYLVKGPIYLKSNINLHLEEGAVLNFSDNPDFYPLVPTSWEGTFLYNYSPLIYANQAENIAITGSGVVNGNGDGNWAAFKDKENSDKLKTRELNHNQTPVTARKFGKGHYLRPQLVQFFDSKKILIEGVKFENSPFWCVHLLRSTDITIDGISYDSQNKNNDGIDLEYASKVLIQNVTFNNSDDNIAIKAGRDTEGRANAVTPSQKIVVRNCKFKGLHALVIGSEMSAGVKDVYVSDSEAWGYLKRGIYFKTNSDRGGYIKNIHISDLAFKTVEDAVFMTANYHGEGSGDHISKISNITLMNLKFDEVENFGIVLDGYPEKPIFDVFLENISIYKAKNALTLKHTEGVRFKNVQIGEEAGTPSAVK
ncbi:glycoside hydrolase family 28 protein [Leeuwenhoekiella marinoflava]|uniref:glycoside hydrolase family 28 protein n=1 Tax=Leeuwenhoekiella marinoflava TaxID=988 RepID=UPI0030030E79